MGSISNPNSLNRNYKDCSQSICTIYCPQWCYFIFPPPPPDTPFANSPVSSARPLIIIAIIGILASIFLLMTIIYIIISKCCPAPVNDQELAVNVRDNDGLAAYLSSGLDEASIRLIAIVKYRKEDAKDCCCSVCLSEFEGESLRVLPKCSHVFHVPCIDTWLASHSSCPLCRSEIIVTANSEDFVPVDYRCEHDSTRAATVVVPVQQHQHSVDISLSVEESNTICYQQ